MKSRNAECMERMGEFAPAPQDEREAVNLLLLAAQRAGIAHNGGAGGQYILVATEKQLAAFARSAASNLSAKE